jgi:hypothetical protein
MKQGELFLSVCGTLKNTSSSDVDSTVNTSTDEAGQTPTRNCIHCTVSLQEGDNWSHGNARTKQYTCTSCDSIKRKKNRLKRLAETIGATVLRSYNEEKAGEVYIITNSAWPEWVKIGMAINAENRLDNYQTSSPLRNYVLAYSVYSKDRRKAEAAAHKIAEKISERRGEWFKMSVGQAKECIQHGL